MKILTWHRFDNIITTLIIIVFLKYLTQFYNIDFLDPVQNFIQDLELSDVFFSKFRNLNTIPKDTNVIIVNIGNLNRKGIAEEINIVNRYQPEVIGIDAYFLKRKTEELDSPLIDAMSQVKKLVLTSKVAGYNDEKDRYDTLITSDEVFNRNAKTGFANFPNEQISVKTTRRFVPEVNLFNGKECSFAVRVAQVHDSNIVKKFLERDNESEVINFRRNLDKYIVIDVNDVFTKSDSLEFLKGKIVLMGFLGPDTSTKVSQDNFITPMNRQYIGRAFPDMYGVVIHANIISMLLEHQYINSMPFWLTTTVTVLLIYLLMAIYTYLRYKYEEWYEAVGLVVLTIMLFGVFLITLYSLKWFHYYMELQAIVYVLIVTEIVSESYHGSLKPLGISLFRKIKRMFVKEKKSLSVSEEEQENDKNET
jgi:CHASE2 domain-containing sensor protein